MLGGYLVIDLKKTNFVTGTAQKIDGIYDRLEATKKVVLLEGIVIDSTEYRATLVELSGSPYTATIYGKKLTISDDDNVKFEAIAEE